MTGDQIKAKIEELKKLKQEAEDRWMEGKNTYDRLGREIHAVIDQCSRPSGKKHAGGGGGLGGRLWIECDGCGHTHFFETRAELDAYPGKITWHSTGN